MVSRLARHFRAQSEAASSVVEATGLSQSTYLSSEKHGF